MAEIVRLYQEQAPKEMFQTLRRSSFSSLTLLFVIYAVLEFVVRVLSFHHFAVFIFYISKISTVSHLTNKFEFGALNEFSLPTIRSQ